MAMPDEFLVVVDMQTVFADPASPWYLPSFAQTGIQHRGPAAAFSRPDDLHPLRSAGEGRGKLGALLFQMEFRHGGGAE